MKKLYKTRKDISRNKELFITLIITLALALVIYVLRTLIESKGDNSKIEEAFMNPNTYSVLFESLPPALIIWCIIGLISCLSGKREMADKKLHPAIAVVCFVLYLLWYALVSVLKRNVVIEVFHVLFFIIAYIILVLFFYEKEEKKS